MNVFLLTIHDIIPFIVAKIPQGPVIMSSWLTSNWLTTDDFLHSVWSKLSRCSSTLFSSLAVSCTQTQSWAICLINQLSTTISEPIVYSNESVSRQQPCRITNLPQGCQIKRRIRSILNPEYKITTIKTQQGGLWLTTKVNPIVARAANKSCDNIEASQPPRCTYLIMAETAVWIGKNCWAIVEGCP